MNKKEAKEIIADELKKYRAMSYDELVKTIDNPVHYELKAVTGKFADTVIGELRNEAGQIILPERPVDPESIISMMGSYTRDIASFFWAILFTIASIGLWKIKTWGAAFCYDCLNSKSFLGSDFDPDIYYVGKGGGRKS